MRNMTIRAVEELFEVYPEPEDIEKMIEEILEQSMESSASGSLEPCQRSTYVHLCNCLTRIVYYLSDTHGAKSESGAENSAG